MAVSGTLPSFMFETSQRHFGEERVERMFSAAISVIAFVFGGQTLAIAIGTEPLFVDVPRTWIVIVVMLSLAAVIATGAAPRFQRIANIVFAVVYLVAVAVWPMASGGVEAYLQAEPWLWYLNSVACACAAQALRPVWAVVYTVITPIAYGVMRTIGPDGMFVNERIGVFDASYALMIGLIIFSLSVAFRSAARRVDAARAAALTRYNEAARQHASHSERVEVDGIVHDTVLAALQAAERARTPEQSRAAVAMASEAITRLATIDGTTVQPELVMSTQRITEALVQYAESLDATFAIERSGDKNRELPWAVGESLYLAAAQAMANSAQHASGSGTSDVTRTVRIVLTSPDSIEIAIEDDGVGFERDSVDPSRLGLRVSIIERVTAAGGGVEVVTNPGEGTSITIRWLAESSRS